MILRSHKDWKIWANVRPSESRCDTEPGGIACKCKYHIVSDDNQFCFGFTSWQDADEKFCAETGEQALQNLLIKQS